MSDDDSALAQDLEELIRAIPGVIAVYPSAPMPAVIAGEILATAVPAARPHLVGVRTDADGTTVTALIGVEENTPAAQTGLSAHVRITDHLARTHTATKSVTVRIGMVG